jgi:dihydrolipoamide dehydrogenase
MKKYNVVIVGGGPGGYVAAIRAAKLGSSVALIEANQLGGTCLNRGCIPSKTLLRHAELIEQIKKANSWGIETGEMHFSIEKMMNRKDEVINRLRSGITSLLNAGKINHYQGLGTVHSDKTITVHQDDETVQIKADKIILATGSTPLIPSIPGINESNVYTSDTIFDITQIPKSVVIIGGGIIGVEFASIFASLNATVTVVEMADRIVSTEEPEISRLLHKTIQKKIRLLTNTKVQEVTQHGNNRIVTVHKKKGVAEDISCDLVLAAAGRKPNLSACKELSLKRNGPFIAVNNRMETSIPDIYAVGDLIGGWQLAHVASAEGLVAASNASNIKETIDYKVVPRCIYTLPEAASVGISEEEAKRKNYEVKTQMYYFAGNGKALTMDEADGFVKIVADKKYGEILGVTMAGPHVTEMISEASAFIFLEGTTEELAKMIHPHPTLSESLYEAAAAWLGVGIHH